VARSPNTVAGTEAVGDAAVSPVDNANASAATGAAPDAAALGLSVPQPLPESAPAPVANVAPTVSIPIADRSIADGPGTVLWRSQDGVELTVKTN
jgi:hypothetical protein